MKNALTGSEKLSNESVSELLVKHSLKMTKEGSYL